MEECPHFVDPIKAPKFRVFDEKIDSIAYSEPYRILEITYRNGQVWQLSPVPPGMTQEIRDTTLWSFIKFIAQRYKAAPVRTGLRAVKVPEAEKCEKCGTRMKVRHRVDNPDDVRIRVLWECLGCQHTEWKKYERS